MYSVKEGHLKILKECFTEEHYHCKTKVYRISVADPAGGGGGGGGGGEGWDG